MAKLIDDIKTINELKSEKKDRQSQYYKEFKKKNPEFYKKVNDKNRSEKFERALLYQYRSYAKRKGIEFNLTIEDIIIPEKCPLIDEPITRIIGAGKVMYNPSIWLMDETLGYIKGNIMIVSILANSMRSGTSKDKLILFAKRIKKLYG